MLSSTLEGLELDLDYPDLQGRRVLVTGVSSAVGVEVSRLLAEHRVRLVMQSCDDTPEVHALAEIVTQSAMDVRLYTGPLTTPDAILKFARSAAQSFGGLDAVINVTELKEPLDGSAAAINDLMADMLSLPCLVSKVVANRMRMAMIDGTILNIVAASAIASRRTRTVAGIARSALAALTRGEAAAWSPHGIRINAIAPSSDILGSRGGACISGTPDVATLALHLASARGGNLSGLVFEGWCG